MILGPIMADVAGLTLSDEERDRLRHPMLGGIILFARNCESPEQVADLVAEIKAVRQPSLLVGIDQEGGRVQRLRKGVTNLPPMAAIGRWVDMQGIESGRTLAHDLGRLLGLEMRALGLDLSFAPVLDLGKGISQVIGDRAFHAKPETVAALARCFWEGMRVVGLQGVGKHFPGHGSVAADSHTDIPVDTRTFEIVASQDLTPFQALVAAGIPGIMPAHVVFPAIDAQAAGFSSFWLQQVLRKRLGFQGCIFSDDLSMAGAAVAGSIEARTASALAAGCDMLLVCNDPVAAEQACDAVTPQPNQAHRLERMRGQGCSGWRQLESQAEYGRLRAKAEDLRLFWGDPG